MKRDTLACLESWSEELLSRAERVRRLIGDAHWLSDGHHKEELVREFLVRHLPPILRVSRGFICPPDDESKVSSEVDILITDSLGEMPWFNEGNLIIAPPSCVRGQLHVKTEFDVKELADVLVSGAKNNQIVDENLSNASPWFGAVFFVQNKASTSKKMAQIFTSAIKNALKTTNRRGLKREWFPDCIAVVGGPVFLAEKTSVQNKSPDSITVRGFDCAKLSPAVLLAHFFDSVQLPGRDLTRRGEWSQLLAKANVPSLFVTSFPLHR